MDQKRHSLFLIVLLAMAALLASPATLPAMTAAQSNPQARIVTPVRDQTVRGNVTIQGTASADAFARYEIAYAAEPDLATWTIVGGGVQPVENGVLAVWNTRPAADGAYALRVQVFNSDGSVVESPLVRNITVANEQSAPGTTDSTEPVPSGAVASPMPTAGVASPGLELSAIPDAFTRGARIALLGFAALGAYIILKKLVGFIFRRLFSKLVDYGR